MLTGGIQPTGAVITSEPSFPACQSFFLHATVILTIATNIKLLQYSQMSAALSERPAHVKVVRDLVCDHFPIDIVSVQRESICR